MPAERLQKILARSGFASRRQAEAVIAAGRVTVNGSVAILGGRADLDVDRVEVDGAAIQVEPEDVTLLLHKPAGFLVTANDERGRRTVYDLLRDVPAHLRYVGRLDRDTSGLLLLTTDGELAHRLSHPRYEVPKVYEATIEGIVPEATLARLRAGITLEEGTTSPARVERTGGDAESTAVRLTIHEGHNRQVRRMFEAVGHRVTRLVRTRFGPLSQVGLPSGESRLVTPEELAALRTLVGLA